MVSDFGKILIIAGILMAIAGVILMFYDKIPFIGKLPGDIMIKRENFTIYIPIATSLLISVLISVILFLINKFRS